MIRPFEALDAYWHDVACFDELGNTWVPLRLLA
jgi:hypothetical protein